MSLPDLSLYGVMGFGSTFSDTKSFIYVIHPYESMTEIVETVWHREEEDCRWLTWPHKTHILHLGGEQPVKVSWKHQTCLRSQKSQIQVWTRNNSKSLTWSSAPSIALQMQWPFPKSSSWTAVSSDSFFHQNIFLTGNLDIRLDSWFELSFNLF